MGMVPEEQLLQHKRALRAKQRPILFISLCYAFIVAWGCAELCTVALVNSATKKKPKCSMASKPAANIAGHGTHSLIKPGY
jgi:hypothetical protein